MNNDEIVAQLQDFVANRRVYRNRGTKNLATLLLNAFSGAHDIFDTLDTEQNDEAEPLIPQPCVVLPAIAEERVCAGDETVELPRVDYLPPPPTAEPTIPEKVEIDEPIEPAAAESASFDMSTDGESVSTVNDATMTRDKVQIGSYSYEMKPCAKCDALREELRVSSNGVRVAKFNYFQLTCKSCQKKRFSSWKAQKKADKTNDKVNEINTAKKAEVRHIDAKQEQLQKLKNIRSQADKNASFKKDLKTAVKNNSNFKLNLFVN